MPRINRERGSSKGGRVKKRKAATSSPRSAPPSQSGAGPRLWTYAIQVEPPSAIGELSAVTALLDREHVAAKRESRVWIGKLIGAARTTKIMIVSDSLKRRKVHDRLEAALKKVKLEFSVTLPMALASIPVHGSPMSPMRGTRMIGP